MAGDWIKMRSNLWDDPRIAKLCDMTDQGEAAIVGGLYWLWSSADQHSEDGTMTGLTLRGIDRKTGIAGFGAALVSAGWIEEIPEGVQIVRFEEHNGKSAKRRCSESVRKMSARDADKTKTDCGSGAHLEKEKSREEVNLKPTPIAGCVPDLTVGAPATTEQPAPTRKGIVCGMLRKAGMADAAPHYLPDDVWETILSKRTDEEIVEVAKAKMATRPGQRTGLKYIAPILMQDPEPIAANARASPAGFRAASTGRQAAIDNYTAQAAAARGEDHGQQRNSNERDITAESIRIA